MSFRYVAIARMVAGVLRGLFVFLQALAQFAVLFQQLVDITIERAYLSVLGSDSLS